jgi:hypothetical protein
MASAATAAAAEVETQRFLGIERKTAHADKGTAIGAAAPATEMETHRLIS